RANWAMALVSMRLQDYDSADRHFRRAIAARPAPDILNDYGVFLCQRGHSDKALNYFRQAATNPRYAQAADAWTNAGVCLARAHRGKEAAGYLRKALATDPKQGQALAQLARLRFQAGDYLAARGFLQRCDAVTPLQGDLLLLAARNELALGEANEARAYLHRYNSGHPGQTITMEQLTDKKHGG
ncbi:MAG: hypothetical protein L0H83_00720, partial [Salinisphaera sp.]|nr:hypothetical protein [Salinisphaera sp.]